MAPANYRRIVVGGRPASIRGLDDIFNDLYEQGRRQGDPGLGAELVREARQRHNFVPTGAENGFAQAMAREYGEYVEQRMTGATPEPTDYGTWRGRPREHVP